MDDTVLPQTRRDLLRMIGTSAAVLAMYQAMTVLGHAAETQFTGPADAFGRAHRSQRAGAGGGPCRDAGRL